MALKCQSQNYQNFDYSYQNYRCYNSLKREVLIFPKY